MPTDFLMQSRSRPPQEAPHQPLARLREVAKFLDREAGFALNRGEHLFAERASHRAEQLRQIAGSQR